MTIDSVTQRWPWNNKVDITYTVNEGQDVEAGIYCRLVFNASVNGETYVIDGVTNVGASASTGTHTITWNPPSGVKTSNCSMTAQLLAADKPSGDDYMVVDIRSPGRNRRSSGRQTAQLRSWTSACQKNCA